MANYSGPPGIDFSNVKRQALYATPSKTPTFSGAGGSSTYSPVRSPSRIPTNSSPAYASSTYASSARRPYTPSSNAGRKRSRLSTATPTAAKTRPMTPSTRTRPRTSTFSPPPSSTASRLGDYATPGYVSPAPLANSHYTLAEGFDTPTAQAADAYDRPVYSAEAERARSFRRLRDDELDRPTYDYGLDGLRDVAGPLARAPNGVDRTQDGFGTSDEDERDRTNAAAKSGRTSDAPQWSVSRALFSTVASAAGFMFHFCTAGAFKGFAAGGGQTWTVQDGKTVPGKLDSAKKTDNENEVDEDVIGSNSWEDPWQDAELSNSEIQEIKAASGRQTSYFETTSSRKPPSPVGSTPGTPPRAAKKLKTSLADEGGLKGNWILVGSGDASSRPASPSSANPAGLRRKTAVGLSSNGTAVGGTPASGRRRRFTATMSIPVGGAGPGGAIARQASSAALRSPGLRASHSDHSALRDGRRSRAGTGTGMGSGRQSGVGLMTPKRHSGDHHAGATGTATATATAAAASPLGREGDRLIRMKNRMEKEEDREFIRMNARLEEMIRQGKEALVTRYEVELADEEMS